MKYLLTLSQDYRIAEAELYGLFGRVSRTSGIAFVTTKNPKLFDRLAYAREVYSYLFSTDKLGLLDKIKEYKWKQIIKKDFCVRIYGEGGYSERELGGMIYDSLPRPKVNLKNPETLIGIFVIGTKYHFGIMIKQLQQNFETRRAHLRPVLHPSSLSPKLARAMVNMSGIKSGTVIDPFCGIGGILIEAGLMGFQVKGHDIDEKMVDGCKKNLFYYNINPKSITLADSIKIKERWDYIVTDLPYGKNTRKDSRLYLDFIVSLKKNLGAKAVIGFPKSAKAKTLISKAGFLIERKINYYIHKSLSKEVFVILIP